VRIFLDANILFSAARSQGAMRELLHLLQSIGHTLVADEYVVAEAHRNLGAKESGQAVKDLLTLLSVVEVSACSGHPSSADVSWLPPKDWPVLLAATHFEFHHSSSSLRGRREAIERGSRPVSA
jgi:HEAT repeat protein